MSSALPAVGSRSNSTIRVGIITPGLAPYRVPLLNRLNQLPNVQVTALLSEAQDRQAKSNLQPWNFDTKVFRTFTITYRSSLGDRVGVVWSPGLAAHLARTHYDLVIALGWTMPNTVVAWGQRKLARQPIVMWDESIPHAAKPLKQKLSPLLRKYFGAFDAYLATSSWCIDYLVSMGAARDRVILFPQVTDNDFFARNAAIWRTRRDEVKREFGIHTSQVILFVGQFIERKGIRPLFDAFEFVAAHNAQVSLVLVGQGNLEPEMQQRRAESRAPERIFIQNHVSQQDLPQYYGMADLFCLPSFYDTFGVVVNEAMASGLPVVTTTRVGAASDLVRDQVNGRVVPPGDPEALAHALNALLDDDARREQMGSCARERMTTWSVDTAADALLECIAMCQVQTR